MHTPGVRQKNKPKKHEGAILFILALAFNISSIFFLIRDFMGDVRIDEHYKLYIYTFVSIVQFIFDLLLKEDRSFINAHYALTILTGGILIPIQMVRYFDSGISVYLLYILYSMLILLQIPDGKRRIFFYAQKNKKDVVSSILLFLIFPSLFAHFAAFMNSNIRYNIHEKEKVRMYL